LLVVAGANHCVLSFVREVLLNLELIPSESRIQSKLDAILVLKFQIHWQYSGSITQLFPVGVLHLVLFKLDEVFHIFE